jgi:hydroxymethylbilane synthase
VSDLSAFGFGAFVKALEDELLSGRGDCAVHSLKDVPTALPESCELAGVLKRGSVCDILISSDGRDLNSLPSGAKIGTSSVRRRAQMRNVRPDLEFVTCRGNINTRLEKLKRGEIDALVLAEVGLERLGVDPGHAFPLPFLTAAGQGAVASEALRGSPAMEILRSLNHIPTWYEITSERAFLAHTGSGCACPIGVRGIYEDGELELAVEAYFIDPKRSGEPEKASVRGRVDSEEDAVSLGDRLWDMTRLSPVFLSYAAAEGGAS